MRNVKKYQVIHYYPNRSTMEFINIGVVVFSETSLSFRMMDESHIHQLNCSTFVDKKVLSGLISYIRSIFSHIDSIEKLKIKTLSLYYDNFSFSDEMEFASSHNCEIESHILFNHYIEHKFKSASSVSRKQKIKENTKTILLRDYSKVFLVKDDEYYDLIISSKKSANVYPTVIGSLISDTDLSMAFRAQLNRPVLHSYYAYVNNTDDLLKHHEKSEHARGLLHRKMGMDIIDFSNDDAIGSTLERWAINM